MTENEKDHSEHQGLPAASDPTGLSAFADWFRNFDWLHVPGAIRAIARVVGAAGSAGAAGLDILTARAEQAAALTRAETQARANSLEALGDAVAQRVGVDRKLAARATQSWFGDQFKRQENREAVASIALEDLRAKPPNEKAQSVVDGPDDDWLNVFTLHATNASTERMRETLAAILAGEIRSPGTFSLRTLSIVSVLDKALVETFIRATALLFQTDFIPVLGPASRGPKYDDLLSLADAGILNLGSSKSFVVGDDDVVTLLVGTDASLLLTPKNLGRGNRDIEIQAAILTNPGRQLVRVIERADDLETIEAIAEQIAQRFDLDFQIVKSGEVMREPFASRFMQMRQRAVQRQGSNP